MEHKNNYRGDNKYSEYKNIKYRCNKCRDMTFIIKDNTAYPCECRYLRQAEDILEKSGISDEFRNKTFDNFNYATDIQLMKAYKNAKRYVNDFENIKNTKNNSIIFTGQVGSGKTHLSLAISNSLMNNGIGVLYMGYRDIITTIKQNIMDPVYYNRTMNKYKKCRLLLIDDLFKGNITGSDINIMFEIINYRYFNNLPIIVSSEKSINELLNIDEAIGSRIIEMSKNYRSEIRGKKLNYRTNATTSPYESKKFD